MTGTSRRKGVAGEREWATRVGGSKVSRTGYAGWDVDSPPVWLAGPLRKWEVKRRGTLPAMLTAWMAQCEDEDADAVAFRGDWGAWWVLIPAIRFVAEEEMDD